MANRYWVGGTGTWDASNTTNWSATSGGAGGASVPTTADTVFFDTNSGTAATITVNAAATGGAVTINKEDIIFSLSGAPTFIGVFTLTSGTINLNTFLLTAQRFSSQNANIRAIDFGTGGIVITGNNGTVLSWQGTNFTITGSKDIFANYSGSTGTRTFNMSGTGTTEFNVPNIKITAGTDIVSSIARVLTLDFTGFKGTYNSGASKIIFGSLIFDSGMTITGSASNHAFSGTTGPYTITTAGLTLDFPMQFSSVGGTWIFSDALTQGSTRSFTLGTSGPVTVKLKSGATSTVGAFATSGSNQKYLQSTTAGSQATLSQASGTVTVSYLSIKDIAATGGATWNAYVDYNNVDQGDNTGWDFSYSPAIDNEFPIALRSFTQPKRF